MRVADFHFDLPPELIAQHPLTERGASRLLFLDGAAGRWRDLRFGDLPSLLAPGDLLVLNDTRVMPARLRARKASGGQVEILIERLLDAREALVHLRASKATRPGARLTLEAGPEIEVTAREGDLYRVRFAGELPVDEVLERCGAVPLPPYIRRAPEAADRSRYQTVYARRAGAVAAPTAGLHFDEAMLASLGQAGVDTAFVTLHVGAGTFQPVRGERPEDHTMHAEQVTVPARVCAQVAACRERGGRVVAVGTTTVRALETAARGGALAPFDGDTRLFILPGFRFRVVDALLTNFHLPGSTLLMLVCAFAGTEAVLGAYEHAVASRYRFFSYGDAMFMTRRAG